MGRALVVGKKEIDYINAVYVDGKLKSEAYKEFINPDIKDVHQAISNMERKREFIDALDTLVAVSRSEADRIMARSGVNMAKLVNKTIEKVSQVLDEAETHQQKIQAIDASAKFIIGTTKSSPMQPQEKPKEDTPDPKGLII